MNPRDIAGERQKKKKKKKKIVSEAEIANDKKRGNFYGAWRHAPRKILKVKTKICAIWGILEANLSNLAP